MQPNTSQQQSKVYHPFYGSGAFKYEVHVASGKQLCYAGIVYADNEFFGEREAYTKLGVPLGYSWLVKVGEAKKSTKH